MSENDNGNPTMWVRGYLPNGFQVSFTIPVTMLDAFETAVAFTDALLKKGFWQNEEGVEPGEQKETVGYICRRVKMNEDDSETPIVDLYSVNDQLTFKILSVYLNTAEDVTAFETASGMKLSSMQVYTSKAAPERGDKLTDKYIYRVPGDRFAVVRKLNPAHAADNMKPKYKFVRWDGVTAPAGQQQPALQTTPTERRELACAIVEIVEAEGADGQPVKRVVYRCADNIFAETTTLKHLADAGYSVKGWGKAGAYTLPGTAIVSVEGSGNRWSVTGVRNALQQAS